MFIAREVADVHRFQPPDARLVRLAGKLRALKGQDLEEGVSTRLIVYCATLIEGDASRRRRGEVVDRMAAAYMLQGALDALQERAANG